MNKELCKRERERERKREREREREKERERERGRFRQITPSLLTSKKILFSSRKAITLPAHM